MKRLAYLLFPTLCLFFAAGLVSCKETTQEIQIIYSPAPDPEFPLIGTYLFDGVEYPIYNAVCAVDESTCSFRFSPQKQAPLTTSLTFQLATEYIGKECNVDDLYHNFDYRLIYEDPAHYYSAYRKLQGGTVRVDAQPNRGENHFGIRIDVRLADGTPLKLEFDGELSAVSEE